MNSSADKGEWACDTSVAIASLDPNNHAHRPSRRAVNELQPVLAGHAAFESYSVLTRMPPPFRLSPDVALRVLEEAFPGSCGLAPAAAAELWRRLPQLGITGGATYDALVGEAARSSGLKLLTIDRRAERTYRLLGVDYRLIT